MANLRELRKRAKALSVDYNKTDTVEDLEEMITAKELEITAAEPETATKPAAPAAPLETATEPAVPPEAPPEIKRMPKKPTGIGGAEKIKMEAPSGDVSPLLTGLKISESNLSQEFVEQAGKHANVVVMVTTANAKMMTAKSRQKAVEAELFKKHREGLIEGGIAKPTEKAIYAEVYTDKAWMAAEQSVIDATEAYTLFKGLLKSYEDRKDMLVQLGTNARSEREQIGLSLHEKAKDALKAS